MLGGLVLTRFSRLDDPRRDGDSSPSCDIHSPARRSPKASRSRKFPTGSAISRSRPLSTFMVTWSLRPPAARVTRSIAPSAARRHMCPECARPDPRVILRRRSRPYEGGEPACRPGSVRPLARGGGHPSGTAVADSLVRSTREHRAGRPQALAQALRPKPQGPSDLAPGGVYLAARITPGAGGLLHHRFTLTPGPAEDRAKGGLLSVALSRGSPRVGVTDHPALRSPDLPHRV